MAYILAFCKKIPGYAVRYFVGMDEEVGEEGGYARYLFCGFNWNINHERGTRTYIAVNSNPTAEFIFYNTLSNGKSYTGAFMNRLCCEKRIKNTSYISSWNT